MSTYTATTSLNLLLWDSSTEVDVEVVIKFTVTKPTMATDIDPAEPVYADVTRFVLRDGATKAELECPPWLSERLTDSRSFLDWLVSEAVEQDVAGKEAAAEARAEERVSF